MNTIFIFLATLALGVKFNIPKRNLALAALVATAGFALVQWLQAQGATPSEAAFTGAFVVAASSEFLARRFRVPAPVISIPGIIPLVPGSVAYAAVIHLVKGEELAGVGVGTKAALTAAAIASGLLLASALTRKILGPRGEQAMLRHRAEP